MNKKIFGGIAIVAIAVAVAFNVSMSNQKQDKASMLALANVEALADGEGPTYTRFCYYFWSSQAGFQYISCYSCQLQYNQQGYVNGECTLEL